MFGTMTAIAYADPSAPSASQPATQSGSSVTEEKIVIQSLSCKFQNPKTKFRFANQLTMNPNIPGYHYREDWREENGVVRRFGLTEKAPIWDTVFSGSTAKLTSGNLLIAFSARLQFDDSHMGQINAVLGRRDPATGFEGVIGGGRCDVIVSVGLSSEHAPSAPSGANLTLGARV